MRDSRLQDTPPGFGRGRRTGNLAVIHSGRADFLVTPDRVCPVSAAEALDEWTLTALGAAAAVAEKNGFNLLWRYLRKGERPEDLVRSLFPHGADAAVLLAPWVEHLVMRDMLADLGVPCVVAFGRHPDPSAPWVVCDNAGGVEAAVRHLVSLGHRRLGFLGGPSSVLDFRERREGFVRALGILGLPVRPELVLEAPLRHEVKDVLPVATRLLRTPDPPSAVVCATVVIAAAVVEAAWAVGLQVPEQVAVVGFDDYALATQISPQLSTVRQPVHEIASCATYLAACAATGQDPQTGSWQIVMPAELVVRESCGAKPVCDEEGEGALTRDQQLRMRQLEALNHQLLDMLYVASHDLRAPLITIAGFADRIEREFAPVLGERGRGALARIQRSAHTMGQLLEALLGLSRSHHQSLVLGRVKVGEVVSSVLQGLEGRIAACGAKVEVSDGLPEVIADQVALQRIFLNLVDNALKYARAREPRVQIRYTPRSDEHEFIVQDNGPGIPAELHDRIFQPFYRGETSQGTEGLGIGLSVVKGLVLRHGGRVWVESQPGAGTAFHFTLPRQPVTGVGCREVEAGVASSGDCGINE